MPIPCCRFFRSRTNLLRDHRVLAVPLDAKLQNWLLEPGRRINNHRKWHLDLSVLHFRYKSQRRKPFVSITDRWTLHMGFALHVPDVHQNVLLAQTVPRNKFIHSHFDWNFQRHQGLHVHARFVSHYVRKCLLFPKYATKRKHGWRNIRSLLRHWTCRLAHQRMVRWTWRILIWHLQYWLKGVDLVLLHRCNFHHASCLLEHADRHYGRYFW